MYFFLLKPSNKNKYFLFYVLRMINALQDIKYLQKTTKKQQKMFNINIFLYFYDYNRLA